MLNRMTFQRLYVTHCQEREKKSFDYTVRFNTFVVLNEAVRF